MRTGRPETSSASLHPVAGTPREVERLLRAWLEAPSAEPLTVATSGSTGAPKVVALSAPALRASASAGLSRLGGPGHWVLALPARYVAGVQVICRSILADTSPVILADHPDLATATAALLGDRRYLAAVPTQLHRWLASAADVAALREYDAVLLGGAAVRPALLDKARVSGIRVVTTYGMSETCGGCVYDGVALDQVAVALGTAGQIRLTGPMLFDGYVCRPELTASVLRDGWLHTPDLGRFDDDGRLEVIGRGDEVVVSGGVNIALPAVEERLELMPELADVALTSRPDPEWGVSVVAVVAVGAVTPDAATPSLGAVRDFVAAALPRSWAPRELVVVDALPMLPSGKVDRARLRTLLDSSDPARLDRSASGRTKVGAARFVRPAPAGTARAQPDESQERGSHQGEGT